MRRTLLLKCSPELCQWNFAASKADFLHPAAQSQHLHARVAMDTIGGDVYGGVVKVLLSCRVKDKTQGNQADAFLWGDGRFTGSEEFCQASLLADAAGALCRLSAVGEVQSSQFDTVKLRVVGEQGLVIKDGGKQLLAGASRKVRYIRCYPLPVARCAEEKPGEGVEI